MTYVVIYVLRYWVLRAGKKAGVFYSVKNGSSFITSKSSYKNLVNTNTGVFVV